MPTISMLVTDKENRIPQKDEDQQNGRHVIPLWRECAPQKGLNDFHLQFARISDEHR